MPLQLRNTFLRYSSLRNFIFLEPLEVVHGRIDISYHLNLPE